MKVDQRVAVGCFVDSCRTCASCKEGHENYCENGFTMTYGSPDPKTGAKLQTFGGYSSNALAPLASRYDAIVDTISAKHDINGPLGCLKRDGTLILVGASPQPMDLVSFPLILGRRKVMGSLVGGVPETQAMLDHCFVIDCTKL